MYEQQVADILAHAERYHTAFRDAEPFRGPSWHFHRRALDTRNAPNSDRHLEYVYAALTAWGMHRMGRGGSKMRPFADFRASVRRLREPLCAARRIDYRLVTSADWDLLQAIFSGIEIMATQVSLVGNSKVMAHILPNAVPPIDRQYTLRYLRNSTYVSQDPAWQWTVLRELLTKFFYPVATDSAFQRTAARWMGDQVANPWDTSVLKVVDNLLIGAQKQRGLRGR